MRISRLIPAITVLLSLTQGVRAGTPVLSQLSPPGGQRGTTIEVDLIGTSIADANEILFYEKGISVVSLKPVEKIVGSNGREQQVRAGTRVRATLKIDKNCPLGPKGIRLRTASGLTDYQRFFVGAYPELDEQELSNQERNDLPNAAKAVAANTTINGNLLEAADIDFYRLTVKKGERISAEIEAVRLGVSRGIPDLYLAICDDRGEPLASVDDSALFVQDPVLSIVAPHDGDYLVLVRDGMYNGRNAVYRLHIGTFSRPTALYPAGGKAGTEVRVKLLGDPVGLSEQTVRVPETLGDFGFSAEVDGVTTPSPNTMRSSAYANVLELEPNDTPSESKAPAATLPIAFNGILDKPGDVDCFRFTAKKGERFQVRALANALGSPVDPKIWVKQVGGKSDRTLQQATDCRLNQIGMPPANGLNRVTLDPFLLFVVPADGEYVIGVEDERGNGSSDAVYRVEVEPETNGLYTYIVPEPENQNQPQLRQTINLHAGNQYTAQVGVYSVNRPYDGELELVALNLPSGVHFRAPRLTPGLTRVPVVFEAEPHAKLTTSLIDLVARPVGGSSEAIPSGYRQTICMNQYGNNDYYLHVTVDKLALAVIEPAPFRIEVEQPKSPLVQNGEMQVHFKIIRAPGYDGPITTTLDSRPAGISTSTPRTLVGDETEGSYTIGASRRAPPDTYPLTFTVMSGGGGRRGYRSTDNRILIASKPFTITVAEPHLEGRIARTSVEKGKTATLTCKLNQLQPFEGKAEATLTRLPRGIELVEPMKEITKESTEVSFTIRATPEALVGIYTGVALDVTVMQKGQPVRQLSGSGLIRVDSPRGVKPKSK